MSITRPVEPRIPPQNLDAEQSVLGSMMLDRDAIARVVEALRPEDFYRDLHRTIYTAILDLFERGEPVDLITVTNKLASMGKLEDIGGATYLTSLPNTVPTSANVEFYAGIVLEKAMLRALITAGTQIASLGYDGADDVSDLIDQAEKLVYGIAARRNIQDFQTIKEILKASFEKIDQRYREKGTVTGVATGFSDFDMLTSGLQPADMVIVAARPSVGKCLSADSEILLEDGSLATIEEIYRRREGRLMTLGGDGKFRWTEPSAFVDDGVKPVFRVTTYLGRAVECTAAHPFLTPAGWLPLSALRAGERVAVPSKVDTFGSRPLRECEVKLLAYFAGGGRASGNALPANADARIVRDFEAAVRALKTVRGRDRELIVSSAWIRRSVGHSMPGGGNTQGVLAHWLIEHTARGNDAHRRSTPPAVFTLPRSQLALFLNRLFATNGWVGITAGQSAHIGYSTPSERMGKQVQHLLLRFGIISRLRKRAVAHPGARRSSWRLQIADPRAVRAFARDIGIFGKEGQIEKVRALPDAPDRTSSPDPGAVSGRPGVRAAMPKDPERLPAGDVCWDEITSIGWVGPKQVYDLTIPQTHNFVANDICVHNTTLALNISQHAALTHKIPVAIFSLETSKEQLVQRILCSEARVDNTKLRTGYLADEDWRKLARAMGNLSEAPIFIDDSASLSVMEMRAKARKLKAEHGLGLIVIDYIQLIQSYKHTENRTQELSEIARGIKSLAKELDIPIIAVSQLSRAVETLGSKRPMLSHLRECVTGNTPVWLADGRRVPIRDLVGTTPSVLALSPEGRVLPARADLVWAVGPRPLFEVRLASGRSIRATPMHRLYGTAGWVRVKDLIVGDRLGIARTHPGLVAAGHKQRATAAVPRRLPAATSGTDPGASPHRGLLPPRDAVPAPASLRDEAIPSPDATANLSWDGVVAVEPAGVEEVFDLTVPGPASWLADGIVSHNSGEIEQVSDLVMFLYREDYYDVDKAQKENKENVCEIIIAKHRNGPIGSIELFFHKEFSRFENLAKRRGT
ncbi:MAG TPA: replicative DNA helicase [bacterium]|nr:replicative DNA helicase [bacterium]